MDSRLADLNFKKLLHYGGQPLVRNRYPSPLACAGYCVSCEREGLLGTGESLDLMSHGCDTSDLERVLGPMPALARPFEQPVLFLLEMPGGDYGNGEIVEFCGFRKRPPVNVYYWTPEPGPWPTDLSHVENQYFYGPYFAYLMAKHNLRNVYITNAVKCKSNAKSASEKVVQNCIKTYLSEEIRIFRPEITFCFGHSAENMMKLIDKAEFQGKIQYLYHPTAIELSQRYGKSRKEMVAENDAWIANVIA
jgi:hypothetical protein